MKRAPEGWCLGRPLPEASVACPSSPSGSRNPLTRPVTPAAQWAESSASSWVVAWLVQSMLGFAWLTTANVNNAHFPVQCEVAG